MASFGKLVIVASCTMRKTREVPSVLRLRRYARAKNRLTDWRVALDTCEVEPTAAERLYAGGFWSVVKELPVVARERGISTTFFVASAGYGLVTTDADLKPYSATFAAGADSVIAESPSLGSRDAQLREWWRRLALWKGPHGYRGPRSLKQVARREPDASLLVIASPVYVRAMADDLRDAAWRLRRPESLVIVSSVTGFPDELQDHLLPSVAALQVRLGGTMGSLHARTARHLLKHVTLPLDAAELRAKYMRMASRIEPRVTPVRKARSDSDVRRFIRSRMNGREHVSCTALLRDYRDDGFKCEQKRFRALFNDEVGRS